MNAKFLELFALPLAFALQEKGISLAGQTGSTFWDVERVVMQIAFLALLIRIATRLGGLITQAQTDREAREAVLRHMNQTADDLQSKADELVKTIATRDESTRKD